MPDTILVLFLSSIVVGLLVGGLHAFIHGLGPCFFHSLRYFRAFAHTLSVFALVSTVFFVASRVAELPSYESFGIWIVTFFMIAYYLSYTIAILCGLAGMLAFAVEGTRGFFLWQKNKDSLVIKPVFAYGGTLAVLAAIILIAYYPQASMLVLLDVF